MYIPILKNRMYEDKLLREYPQLFIDDKIMPMIEIIRLKKGDSPISSRINEMIEEYRKVIKTKFFIDFFTFDVNKYKPFDPSQVQFPILIQTESELKYFDLLKIASSFEGVIPVVSINPGRKFVLSEDYLRDIISKLQLKSPQIAIRIDCDYLEEYFSLIDTLLRESDYLMYDISESDINPFYYDLLTLDNRNGGYKTIIINSPRKRTLYNDRYIDGNFTSLIDNSVREIYKEKGFSGFADYAGLKDSLPTSGGDGRGAALALMYLDSKNKFYSLVNKNKDQGASGYSYVLDRLVNSCSELLNPNNDCLAFKFMENQLINRNKSGNFAMWNYITILRYISQIKMSTNI